MSYPPGIWPASCAEVFAASGAPLILAAPPSESSLTKSRQPPSSPNKLLVVTDPRANHQPFTVYLNVPTYFRSGKADCPLPEQGQGAPSAGLMCRGLAGKRCTSMAPTPMSTCTRSHLKRPWRDGKGWAGGSWKAVHPGGISGRVNFSSRIYGFSTVVGDGSGGHRCPWSMFISSCWRGAQATSRGLRCGSQLPKRGPLNG